MKFVFSYEYPFYRFGYGGGQQIARGLARQLARWGHEVQICCSGSDEMGVAASDAPVTFHFSGEYDKRWSGFQTAWRTWRLVNQLRPDWVCCYTSEAALVIPLCNRLKIPAVVYLAAPDLPSFRFRGWSTIRSIRYRLPVFMQSVGARVARKVTTISDFSSRQANENWGIPCQKVVTVGTGLDEVFLDGITPSVRSRSGTGLRFISIGRLALRQKPLDIVAEALAEVSLPWQQWTLVGSGHDESTLRARLAELGLLARTAFAGTQTSMQIAALLSEHDIVLLPSNHESFFIAVYEAVAKGKVVVTNDVADVRKYFGDTPSVIVAESVSSKAYRYAIVKAMQDFEQLKCDAVEAAERVKREYNWSAVATRFVQALE